jgi:hypothetical protein
MDALFYYTRPSPKKFHLVSEVAMTNSAPPFPMELTHPNGVYRSLGGQN